MGLSCETEKVDKKLFKASGITFWFNCCFVFYFSSMACRNESCYIFYHDNICSYARIISVKSRKFAKIWLKPDPNLSQSCPETKLSWNKMMLRSANNSKKRTYWNSSNDTIWKNTHLWFTINSRFRWNRFIFTFLLWLLYKFQWKVQLWREYQWQDNSQEQLSIQFTSRLGFIQYDSREMQPVLISSIGWILLFLARSLGSPSKIVLGHKFRWRISILF